MDRVQQNTYEDIAFEIIGAEYDIEDPNEKLARIIDNNKSQKEVCIDLGISKSTLSRYENDERTPDFPMAKIFADYYGVSLDALFGDLKKTRRCNSVCVKDNRFIN